MNTEWLIWFMGGIGLATLVYVIVDVITEPSKNRECKTVINTVKELKDRSTLEQDLLEEMKQDIRTLRSAYGALSMEWHDFKTKAKAKTKAKKKR